MITPSWEDLFSDEHLRLLAMQKFGIVIPEGATKIKLSDHREYRTTGTVTKLYPDQRYSLLRNPTYTMAEEPIVAVEGYLTWRDPDGQRMGVKVRLDG